MLTKILFFILGVAVVFGLAFAWSNDRNLKKIRYHYLIQILFIQVLLAFFLLKSGIGDNVIKCISDVFTSLANYCHTGSEFVFGSLTNMKTHGFIFFFDVGLLIVFISALIGILQYLKILPKVVRFVGFILSKITGMGTLESFNAVSSITLGQTENFINYKNIINHLPENVLYTMSATAMSTVSLAVAAAYTSLIPAEYVCVAIIMNMFGTFFVLTIINPYENSDKEFSYKDLSNQYDNKKQGFFEMLVDYMLDGFKIAIITCALLVGFIALLAMVNSIFDSLFGVSFEALIGYIFYPFAWVLDIPTKDLSIASQIMGVKIVTNEFIAMTSLKHHATELSTHTKAVISVFLVSFSNFGSIGMIIGAVKGLNEEASVKVAKFGLKILYSAVLVSFLSAVVVGLVV